VRVFVCMYFSKEFLSPRIDGHELGMKTTWLHNLNTFVQLSVDFQTLNNFKATSYISGSGRDRLKPINKSLTSAPTLTVCINYKNIVISHVESLYNCALYMLREKFINWRLWIIAYYVYNSRIAITDDY
jgi:hypothetical protein